METDDKV